MIFFFLNIINLPIYPRLSFIQISNIYFKFTLLGGRICKLFNWPLYYVEVCLTVKIGAYTVHCFFFFFYIKELVTFPFEGLSALSPPPGFSVSSSSSFSWFILQLIIIFMPAIPSLSHSFLTPPPIFFANTVVAIKCPCSNNPPPPQRHAIWMNRTQQKQSADGGLASSRDIWINYCCHTISDT